jgi:hypothetical protein
MAKFSMKFQRHLSAESETSSTPSTGGKVQKMAAMRLHALWIVWASGMGFF